MAAHNVICVDCGKQFDASKEGAYLKAQGRYICGSCLRKRKATAREAKTGMRQTKTAMIIKIVLGVVFIITSFTIGEVASTIIGIIIGLALIAWGLLPWLNTKKNN